MINLKLLLDQHPATIDKDWMPGWRVHWTGFKTAWDIDRIVAQHIAMPTIPKIGKPFDGYYSSTPGIVTRCYRGDMFDISGRNGLDWEKLAEMNPAQQGLYISDLKGENLERLRDFMEADHAFDSPRMICEMSALGAQCHAPATEKVGDSWVCRPCRDRAREMAANAAKGSCFGGRKTIVDLPAYAAMSDSRLLQAMAPMLCSTCHKASDRCGCTVTLPALMKCPRCGTNPGRCEKPLDSTEKTCFSCGSTLEPL